MKKWIAIAVISYFLLACDPIISYNYFVDNQSDKSLVFRYKHGYAAARDSLTVCAPHKITLIEIVEMRGANPHDEKKDFLYPFDKLNVKTIDSGQVFKDIRDRNNWTYSNEVRKFGTIKVGANHYTLKIDNQDLKK
ncbi:hypothetical protein HYN48_04090 [Flavobacterium magnum]|uniref:Lipoprotein n=1 Tax=Flavobacterium magnum TaxID=2162713 RepID=A0A2S0RF40_9FLAO|nr:hypothetical protein [Flavobacterium magnum]AWA29332.1 hypothetical protein HYN48_04090 [Flavobacterium magnum]